MSRERPLLCLSRKDLVATRGAPKHVHSSLPADWLNRQLVVRDDRDEEAAQVESPAGETLAAVRDGEADFRLTPSGGEMYLLQGDVRATIETTCGRCLGPAQIAVDAELALLLVPKAESRAHPKGKKTRESNGEFEFDPTEGDIVTYEGETIILDDVVREAILLELPISPLCSEACPGMRSDPAVAEKLAGERIDPRLARLKDFLPRPGGEGEGKEEE